MIVDYLVVGAGIVGLSTAYHLKRSSPESRVVILERARRVGMGNSGRSAALFRNLFFSATSRVLSESSIEYYETIADNISLKATGYLWTFSESVWKESGEAIRRLAEDAKDVALLDGGDLARILRLGREAPPPFPAVHAAMLGRRCGSISALALAEHYAQSFVAAGGEIRTGRALTALETDGRACGGAPWATTRFEGALDSSGERYSAGIIVVAAGSWLQDILGTAGIASGVYPKKRQLFGIRIADPTLVFAAEVSPESAPNLILPVGSIYLKPILSRGIILAGCADELGRPFELPYAPAERPEPEEDYFRAAIEPPLRAYFPALSAAFPEALPLANSWAGHYDYYWPDKNPVVERIANLIWTGGSSGSGIMKADAIGRVAAAKARGDTIALLADGNQFIVDDLSLRCRRVDGEKLII